MSNLSGTDSITIRNNYDVACPMNFRKYPYDTQICKVKYESCEFSHDSYPIRISFILDGYTTKKMSLKWKKGFDQSKVKMISQRYLKTYETKIYVGKKGNSMKKRKFFQNQEVAKGIGNIT